tara:strand:+ start:922 stop:1170 length:249 start_codon:yes stop_codon:yes gene_type:complete
LVRITRSPDDEYGGAFSPDSKFIYYSATDPAINSRSFYKIKTDGTKPKSIRGTARVGGFVEMNGKFYFTARGGFKRIKPKDR